MKFLCFSDLHRDVEAAAKLVEKSSDADVVIGAGDFATRRHGVEDTLKVLAVGRQTMAMQLNERLKNVTPLPENG